MFFTSRFFRRKHKAASLQSLPTPTDARRSSADAARDQTAARCSSISTENEISTAYNVAKLTLSLAESVADGVPLIGDPFKAAVGGALKILDSFDVSDPSIHRRCVFRLTHLIQTKSKNKKLASRLARKLHDLDKRVEQAKVLGNYETMRLRVEELVWCVAKHLYTPIRRLKRPVANLKE